MDDENIDIDSKLKKHKSNGKIVPITNQSESRSESGFQSQSQSQSKLKEPLSTNKVLPITNSQKKKKTEIEYCRKRKI